MNPANQPLFESYAFLHTPKPVIDRVLETAKKEPALFVQLKQVANMEEFQKGLAIATEVFNEQHSSGSEFVHLHNYNEASKAAVVKFGKIIFEVFNTQLNVEPKDEDSSDFANDDLLI